jgi:hypothetical protein
MYIRPKQEFRPSAPLTRREGWSRRFQYLYFLRFCLLGWLLLPLMCLLDARTGVSALSRGIMTLSSGWQAFHATFFVVTLTTTTLVCARNIVMNGGFRFASPPPVRLYDWLTECKPNTLWTVLGVAQIPAIVTLWYVACTTIREQVDFPGGEAGAAWPSTHPQLTVCGWYAAGLAAAFAFWYLVTLFYLWTHEWVEGDGPRALIFPSLLPEVEDAMQGASKPRLAEWLERAMRLPLKFTHIGYAPSSDGPLWELHFLTTVSLVAFVLLYLFLYPVVAPVVTTTKPGAEIAFAVAICICVLLGASQTGSRWKMQKAGVFFSALFLLLLGSFVYLLISDICNQSVKLERSFPVLASVIVILIFGQWGINGASFFFDRYRVPVLTSAVLLIFLPKLALSFTHPAYGSNCIEWVQTHIIDWDADHYFEARQIGQVKDLPNPTAALDKTFERVKAIEPDAEDQPLVVVTATGGGIQAAEWTAEVMARLEREFREDKQKQPDGYSLHDHLLLASGVSGGSDGLLPYLLEYTRQPGTGFPANDDLRKRLTIGPGCSSLEAVAWGLEYYDLQRLALTFRFPILQSAQDAPDDKATIVAPDRTWALSRAFNRNLNDVQCGVSPDAASVPDAEKFTLGQAAINLKNGTMPAFTFNTTVAETGGRFLLSNYMVPRPAAPPAPAKPNTEFLPAESFLQTYAQETCSKCANGPDGEKLYADLPLSTAARLGATFPLVSSATRIPPRYATAASHFLDGGYFDNDGTGSAIEFLYSVMEQRKDDPNAKPLKVLLVEIRDGPDLDPNVSQDSLEGQSGYGKPPAAWWTLDQLLGPLDGLWNAGHDSVTRRNRRELCVLETAYQGKLLIHHVVFTIPQQTDDKHKPKPAPLSWKLTASQLAYISSVANGEASDKAVKDAMGWVAMAETTESSKLPSEVCSVSNAPLN